MKHKPENKETIYDEENEMIEHGFGTRRDPEHFRHLAYQHWGNEKHAHKQREYNEKHSSFFEQNGLTILGKTPKRFL
jgi:hypothetical protein